MGLFLDFLIVFLFILFIFIGTKKGFIKSVVSFIGSFGALLAAGLLSRPIASGVFDLFFRNPLRTTVETALLNAGAGSATEKAAQLLRELPGFLRSYIEANNMQGQLEATVNSGVATASDAVVNLVSPLFISFLSLLAFFVLFLIARLVIKLFSKVLEGLFKAPLLGTANRALGGILGAARAFLFCLLIGVFLYVFVPLLDIQWSIFSPEIMKQSSLFSYFYSTDNVLISLFSGF